MWGEGNVWRVLIIQGWERPLTRDQQLKGIFIEWPRFYMVSVLELWRHESERRFEAPTLQEPSATANTIGQLFSITCESRLNISCGVLRKWTFKNSLHGKVIAGQSDTKWPD